MRQDNKTSMENLVDVLWQAYDLPLPDYTTDDVAQAALAMQIMLKDAPADVTRVHVEIDRSGSWDSVHIVYSRGACERVLRIGLPITVPDWRIIIQHERDEWMKGEMKCAD